MNYLRNVFVLVILGLWGLSAISQPGFGRRFEDQMQAIDARRVAHITEKLSLTPKEAQVFWPVYNEYLEKVSELSKKQREWHQEVNRVRNMSDAEWAKLAEAEVIRAERSAALRREYHEKLKEILPIKKVALLYEAEQSFNRLLVREAQHRMRGRE